MIQVQSVSDLIQMKRDEYSALLDELNENGQHKHFSHEKVSRIQAQLHLVLEEIRFLQEHQECQARDYTFMFKRSIRDEMYMN